MERSRLFALLAALLALPWQAGGQQAAEDTQGEPIGLAAFREGIASGRYLVGPGDQFLIYVTGMALATKSRVMAEGGLFIPGVGLVPVGGLRLRDAHAAIDSAFRQAVTIGDIDVELSKPRSIPVPVLGLVSNPGILLGTGVDRVSTILQRAGGTLGSNRDIRLIRTTSQSPAELARLSADLETGDYSSLKGFESVRIDLDMYNATGRLGLNPFIEDGDIIFVPGRRGQITAVAAVMRPGTFEFVEGDRLSDLLELALGPALNHDPDNVLLFRYGDDLTQMYATPLDIEGILRRDPVADLPLRDGDWLVLRRIPRYHEPSTLTVLGEFVYPGEYVVDVDGTPLSKVIEGAGGFTKDASLQRGRVIRREEEEEDLNFARIATIPVADRTEDEDQYFIMKSIERSGRLVVDFTALYQGDVTQDIQLLPGDAILVPRLQQMVKVSGSAANPGAVIYHPGDGVEDYIGRAGGRGWRASDKIRVIKARTGEMESAADNERIDPGDRIWIKEKPERDHWSIFTEATAVIGQAATLVLLYVSITK